MARWSPTVEPGYYGPENPGEDLARAIHGYIGEKRQEKLDTEAEQDRQRRIQREDELDPIQHALLMANLIKQGILPPGGDAGAEAQTPGTPSFTLPTMDGGRAPAAGGPPAFRLPGAPPSLMGGAGAAGHDMLFRTPVGPRLPMPMDPGMSAGGAGAGPGFQIPQGPSVAGTAHALPGAFNPITGQHNSADIDLGGGYRMPYEQTPAGQRASSITGLEGFGFSPEEAMYLAQHPEHIAPFLAHRDATARPSPYGPEALDFLRQRMALERSNRLAELAWERAHPGASAAAEKPEMTLAGALEEVDRLYGYKDAAGQLHSRLSPQARMRLAQQMTSPHFDPSALGPSRGFGGRDESGAPSYEESLRAHGIEPTPRTPKEQQQDRAGQINTISRMIPPGADPDKVRTILKSHGLSDDEIDGVLQGRAGAVGAGSRF